PLDDGADGEPFPVGVVEVVEQGQLRGVRGRGGRDGHGDGRGFAGATPGQGERDQQGRNEKYGTHEGGPSGVGNGRRGLLRGPSPRNVLTARVRVCRFSSAC